MRRVLVVFVILAAGVGFYFRHDIVSLIDGPRSQEASADQGAEASDVPDCPALEDQAEPKTLNLGIVVDPTITTATQASFAPRVIAGLAAKLGAHVPPKSTSPQDGTRTVDAVNLVVKLVGSRSYAYQGGDEPIRIPGVRGLPPRPSIECLDVRPGRDSTYTEWEKLAKQWSLDYDAAISAVAAAVEDINSMDLPDVGGHRDLPVGGHLFSLWVAVKPPCGWPWDFLAGRRVS